MRTSSSDLAALALVLAFACALYGRAATGSESDSHVSRVSRHYFLPATPENVQWGWYDPNEKPKLVIHSGDTVSIETVSHSLGQIKPGLDMGGIVKLRKENDGGGPHSITGPIYVSEAEPGDTLEVRILKIVPKPDAFNFPARQGFSERGPAGAGISRRLRALLQARSGEDADRVQAGNHDRPEALSRNVCRRGR